MTDIYWNYI